MCHPTLGTQIQATSLHRKMSIVVLMTRDYSLIINQSRLKMVMYSSPQVRFTKSRA
jgi:hypothetical protein